MPKIVLAIKRIKLLRRVRWLPTPNPVNRVQRRARPLRRSSKRGASK